MNYIKDSQFENIAQRTRCFNADIAISNDWRIKTTVGEVNCYASKEQGVRLDAYFPNEGFIYVRQLIPDVQRFSRKKLLLRTSITRASWQPLKCDVYIQARFSADDADRVLVCDTGFKELKQGLTELSIPVTVPDLSSYPVEPDTNALSVAVRLYGINQNTLSYVDNVTLEEVSPEPPTSTKLTTAQYDAVCLKLKELT